MHGQNLDQYEVLAIEVVVGRVEDELPGASRAEDLELIVLGDT
jgi:hypothetical protein